MSKLRISEKDRKTLKKAAKRKGITIHEYIENMIKKAAKKLEKKEVKKLEKLYDDILKK